MDYIFYDTLDVRLITLFIIDNFKMPVPNTYIVDTIMLQPVINYFDLEENLSALVDEGFATYYKENSDKMYSLTKKGRDALDYFSSRIPKTVRQRLLSAIKLKLKELKNAISIKADFKKINDIEYSVSLGITEGLDELFSVSVSVGDEKMASKMCAQFKKDPQSLYSEILSVLIKDNI